MKPFKVADLFCGAGGTSTGIIQAAETAGRKVHVTAVNHWDRAIETHAMNHPTAAHFCQDLTRLKPIEAVPGGKLDLLVASPECTHHSNARGGKPKNDQSRASAWIVIEWINALSVDRVLIENVPEFKSWGPLGSDGKPLKSRRGHTFDAFINALKASGYTVDHRILNAADFGAATSRRRLFIQAAKGRRVIVWPSPSHTRTPGPGLFGTLPKWRAAREVIDWSLAGSSIFSRKRPLSPNTMKRIEAGLRKFGGVNAEPFLIAMNYLKERGNDGRAVISLDSPLPTITSQGNRFAFIIPQFSGADPRSVDRPVSTITTTSRGVGLVDAFLADMRGTDEASLERTARSVDEPHPGITAGGTHTALVEPHMVQLTHGGRELSVDEALPTITTANRGEIALVEPFVMRACNGGDDNCRVKSPDEPLGTIHAGGGSYGLVEPFILPHRQFEQMDVDSVEQPHRTITAQNGGNNALVEPFVVPYYGTSGPAPVSDPLATVTCKDRFALVEPQAQQMALDIRFRMLQPGELSAAMGFPTGYKISGNRADQVKQIGNAVEVNQARALVEAFVMGKC